MEKVRIVLRAEEGADGTYPIALRISKNGKPSYVYTGERVLLKFWDENKKWITKNHPNFKRLDNLLTKKLSEAKDKYLETETAKPDASIKAIRNKIKPKAGDTFFPQAQLYLDSLKNEGKYNRYTADKPRIKHFKEFCDNQDIAFSDITVGLLERFKAYLKGGDLKLSERSAINHWVVIRSVFSQAKKEGIIDEKTYPFGKGKISIKFPDTKKIGLTKEEIKAIEDLPLPMPYHHSRNLFLTSYYFAGARAGDILRLKWSDFHDGRLFYTMNKNDKTDSLKIPPKAQAIIDQYREEKDETDLVFPDLKGIDPTDEFKMQRQIAFSTSRHDKYLKLHVANKLEITKKVTMHIARHTFAQNAADIVDARTLQMLFRHSKLETTVGYMGNFSHKKKDDALDNVLGK